MLIGLNGYGGVGKDTVADILVARFGFQKFSFSDTLYEEVSTAFGVPIDWLQNRDVKEKPQTNLMLHQCNDYNFYKRVKHLANPLDPLSPRQVLQWWGTEYRREENPEYWIEKAEEKVWCTKAPLVNTSVRFINEAVFILKHGGLVWSIGRGIPKPNSHVAEQALPQEYIDFHIWNNSTIHALEEKVVELYEKSKDRIARRT